MQTWDVEPRAYIQTGICQSSDMFLLFHWSTGHQAPCGFCQSSGVTRDPYSGGGVTLYGLDA